MDPVVSISEHSEFLNRLGSSLPSELECFGQDGPDHPAKSAQPVLLRFSLTPAAAVIRAGEALELDLASRTDLLHIPAREGFIVPDMAVPPYFARNTVHHGPETFLELRARFYIGST